MSTGYEERLRMEDEAMAALKEKFALELEVINHAIDLMLHSQLLFEEDQQIILSNWPPIPLEQDTDYSNWIFMLLSSAGTVNAIRESNWTKAAASWLPTCLKVGSDLNRYKVVNNHKKKTEELLKFLKIEFGLNRDILDHFSNRKAAIANLSEKVNTTFIAELIRKHETEAACVILKNNYEICYKLRENIKKLTATFGFDKKSYSFICTLMELDTWHALETHSLANITSQFENLYHSYMLLCSSFLSCLTVSFSLKHWKNAQSFQYVTCEFIPEFVNYLDGRVTKNVKLFDDLRYKLVDLGLEMPTPCYNVGSNSIYHAPISDCIDEIQSAFDISTNLWEYIKDGSPNENSVQDMLYDLQKQHDAVGDVITTLVKMNNVAVRKINNERKKNEDKQSAVVEEIASTSAEAGATHQDDVKLPIEDEGLVSGPKEVKVAAVKKIRIQNDDEYLVQCISSQRLLIRELRAQLKEYNITVKVTTTKVKKPTKKLIISIPNLNSSTLKRTSAAQIMDTTTNSDLSDMSECSMVATPSPKPMVFKPTYENSLVQKVASIAKRINQPEENYGGGDKQDTSKDEENILEKDIAHNHSSDMDEGHHGSFEDGDGDHDVSIHELSNEEEANTDDSMAVNNSGTPHTPPNTPTIFDEWEL